MPQFVSHPAETGVIPVDVAPEIDKVRRVDIGATGAVASAEKNPGYGDWGLAKLADICNVLLWGHDHAKAPRPRGGWGSWSFAVPAIAKVDRRVTVPGIPGIPGTALTFVDYAPLMAGAGVVDDDFVPRRDIDRPNYLSKRLPSGTVSAILQGTGHGLKMPVSIGAGGPLVAQQRGNELHDYSSFVNEIADNGLDQRRRGLLSDTHWVRGWVDNSAEADFMRGDRFKLAAGSGFAGGLVAIGGTFARPNPPPRIEAYAALLNGTRSAGRVAGYATFTHSDVDASYSYEVSGPLRPATAKHKIWETFDGRDWNAGSISTMAYINAGDPDHDCPAEHEEPPHPKCGDGVFPFHVHKMVDSTVKHPFLGSERDGLWRRHVRIPVTEKPPCDGNAMKDTDGNGNPHVTHPTFTSVWAPQGFQTTYLTFQAAPGILRGAPAQRYWGP